MKELGFEHAFSSKFLLNCSRFLSCSQPQTTKWKPTQKLMVNQGYGMGCYLPSSVHSSPFSRTELLNFSQAHIRPKGTILLSFPCRQLWPYE